MRYISPLNEFEIGVLEEYKNNSSSRRERIRAEALLLSNKKYKIKEISEIVNHDRDTISSWFKKYEEHGLGSISDAARSGRPPKLNEINQILALSSVAETPTSLKAVIAKISEELKINISVLTLKRILKKFGISWKRVRKSLKSRRDDEEYQRVKEEIKELIMKAKKKA